MHITGRRRRAIQMFRAFSAFQFVVGFLLLFFGSYAVASRNKYPIVEGAPYYSGAYFPGIALLVLSGFGGAVYHNGQQYHMDISVWLKVHPVLKVYKILCPFVLICCCIGIALTGMFGLCHRQTCSYNITDFNFGIAALLVTLELSALLSTVLSILVCRYCGKEECCTFIKQTQNEPRKSNDTVTKPVEGVGKYPQKITVRPVEGQK